MPRSKDDGPIRLQKYLAHRGVASRRRCEEFISEGLVTVNGLVVTQMGTRIRPGVDRIEVNSAVIRDEQEARKTLLVYKPRGYVCTRSGNEGRTVFSLLDKPSGSLAVAGRLDKNSEGLVILSEDGDLVHRLTHPRFGHDKCYQVTVSGKDVPKSIPRLNSRMTIDGYRIRPARVQLLRSSTRDDRYILEFVLREGRNRQIRKMCQKVGLKIHRLVRTRIAHLTKAGLKPGSSRALSSTTVARLKS